MIRIFEKDGKINFVDSNNVFVGYDMHQDCCEYADWFILPRPVDFIPDNPISHQPKSIELENHVFDKEYFHQVNYAKYDPYSSLADSKSNALDDGEMVIFKMTMAFSDYDPLYLHLFNCHNGYYGHGFEFKIGDEVEREGVL